MQIFKDIQIGGIGLCLSGRVLCKSNWWGYTRGDPEEEEKMKWRFIRTVKKNKIHCLDYNRWWGEVQGRDEL